MNTTNVLYAVQKNEKYNLNAKTDLHKYAH